MRQNTNSYPMNCFVYYMLILTGQFFFSQATAAIEGICLDVSDIRELHLSPFVFEKMDNLRLLMIFDSKVTKKRKVCFDEDLQTLPGNLNYLHWEEYPLKSLPTNFTAENLVELCMPHSQLEKLWIGVQVSFNFVANV